MSKFKVEQRYYDPIETKFFEIREIDTLMESATCGGHCDYWSDSHTIYSEGNQKLSFKYINNCQLITEKSVSKIFKHNGNGYIAEFKLGDSMSKYEYLKQRIEALDDGWNKDADDIIKKVSKGKTLLIIDNRQHDSNSRINIYKSNPISFKWNDPSAVATFRFNNSNQCEKMEAFKKALLWLLDHSGIKKVDKKREARILKLENDSDRATIELERIKKELEGLKR